MMDGAYFVGRGEILNWINATLQLSLAKVEEVGPALPSPPFRVGSISRGVRFRVLIQFRLSPLLI
jgi:hypothetical protein